MLQEPWVVALLVLLATAITANFAGLYRDAGPPLESAPGAGSSGAKGAFGTGLLAAFVATPCTGPFMAAAVGAALVLPWWAALRFSPHWASALACRSSPSASSPRCAACCPARRLDDVPPRHGGADGPYLLALFWLAWRLGGGTFGLLTVASPWRWSARSISCGASNGTDAARSPAPWPRSPDRGSGGPVAPHG
jgi:hypothetical protein